MRRTEIAARREARIRNAAEERARLESARATARALLNCMPADFQGWGVMRTRAYLRLLEIVGSKVENVTLKARALEGYLSVIDRASEWSLPYCVHLSRLHARAVNVSMTNEGATT